MKAQKGRRGITLLPSALVLEGAEGLMPYSGPFLLGFKPWILQPVVDLLVGFLIFS